MKKFAHILSLLIFSGIIFTGCYTQVATRDRTYPDNGNQQGYGNDQGYTRQYQDSVYDDSSGYYSDNDYDSTGYDSNYSDDSYYDRGNNSPYYYDDFYNNFPTYRRYFWGYHPSVLIGFGWNNWNYDPFYCNYWDSWYYPGSWSCLPYYYYYPSPYYFGFNYYYGFGYPSYYHNYFTHRDRTRDLTRIRNLDGLRGGRGRNVVIGTNTGGVGRDISVRNRENTRISTRNENTGKNTNLRKNETGRTRVNTRPGNTRIRKERSFNNSGRVNPNLRSNRENKNFRLYRNPPLKREYAPRERDRKQGYNIPKRNSSGYYNPQRKEGSPRNYNPPQHNYSPPQRSYNPPSSHNSGGSTGRSNGGGRSSGRGR